MFGVMDWTAKRHISIRIVDEHDSLSWDEVADYLTIFAGDTNGAELSLSFLSRHALASVSSNFLRFKFPGYRVLAHSGIRASIQERVKPL